MPLLDHHAARRALRATERLALSLVANRLRLLTLAGTAERRRPIKTALVSVSVFPRLLRAYARREFTRVPWQSLVTLTAALLYFVTPLDLIPDLVPIAGLLDDTLVLELAAASIRKDINAFLAWEKRRHRPKRKT